MIGDEVEKTIWIINQTSLAQEKFSLNGVQKTVHIVVKNQPFHLQPAFSIPITLAENSPYTIKAKLIYDTEEEVEKEVDFVSMTPMEYKVQYERGELTVEVRLKVLSSQLEDMFFRIKLILTETASKKEFCSTLSQPIKVISKPDQLTKKAASKGGKRHRGSLGNINDISQLNPHNFEGSPPPNTANSTLTHNILDVLRNMEQQQRQQAQHLDYLCNRLDRMTFTTSNPSSAFDSALSNVLALYETLSTEEKTKKIRNITRNTTNSERLNNFLNTFWAESMRQTQTQEAPFVEGQRLPFHHFPDEGGSWEFSNQ